jgi:undecaprenyl-diphosphatase
LEPSSASGLFDTLAARPGAITAALGLLAFVESLAFVGIVTPGIALLAAGALAAGAAGVPLSAILAAAWLGAVLGDGLSFLVGYRYGPALRARVLPARFRPWLVPGERFFARHGILGVVLGRFLGPLRPVVPIVAGMLRMDLRLFFAVNLASALAWAPSYLVPGYLVGASLGQALRPPADWPIALVIAGLLLWGTARATRRAWREGERDGRAAQAFGHGGPAGRWLTASLTRSGGADTRLSLLLASTVLLSGVMLAWSLLKLPAAAGWRAFLADLVALLVRLW